MTSGISYLLNTEFIMNPHDSTLQSIMFALRSETLGERDSRSNVYSEALVSKLNIHVFIQHPQTDLYRIKCGETASQIIKIFMYAKTYCIKCIENVRTKKRSLVGGRPSGSGMIAVSQSKSFMIYFIKNFGFIS